MFGWCVNTVIYLDFGLDRTGETCKMTIVEFIRAAIIRRRVFCARRHG